MNRIVLIGMPCSYKSSVGRRLAKMLEVAHIDTDIELENSTGSTIVELLEHGEQWFRQQESLVVARIHDKMCVVSTGGGVVEVDSNMRKLCANSTVVWLNTSADVVYYRLRNSNLSRPLVASLDMPQLQQFVNRRNQMYSSYADITLCTDNIGSRELAQQLYNILMSRQ